LTLRYFQTDDLEVEQKKDASPVTIADRQAEQLLRERIAAAFPHDAILGEEFPERPGTSGYRWILDPIDGTRSFVRGVPLYGTMVAVERDQASVIGVVYLPPLDECFYAATGQGAWHERGVTPPQQARVSSCARLSDALLTASDTRCPTLERQEVYNRLQRGVGTSRTWGDCYGYMLVATGRAEVMIDPMMNLWDTAAVAPIVVEAGGTFTDWQGRPTIYGGEAIATNGRVLEEVLKFTRGE
jgi:histidinol phosphatase-like enzyme (inositol monophosphatase family)